MKKANPLKRLYREYFIENQVKFYSSIILAIIGSFTIAIGPKRLGDVTTIIYEGIMKKIYGTGGVDFESIGRIVFSLISLYIIGTISLFLQGKLITDVIQKIIFNLRMNIIQKINKLPISYFDNYKNKKIFSIIDKDIEMITQYLNIIINETITCVSLFIMIIFVMFSIHKILAIITIFMIPCLLIMIKIIFKIAKPKINKTYEKNDEMNRFCEETFYRQKLIKNFGSEDKIIKNFEIINNDYKKASNLSQFISMIIEPFTTFIGNLNYLVIVVIGVNLTIKGVITIGDIQSFIQYNKLLVKPVYMIGQVSNIIFSALEALNRVFDFLDLEEMENYIEIPLEMINGDISIKNLEFSYDNNENILKNINLHIKKGQKVAIVGKTGAGKTTIMKLLMKFYESKTGEILINNKEIKQIDTKDLRNHFGIVLQDSWLFRGTIRENIMYGNPEATEDDLIEATKIAQVHEYIESLPDKYETILDETSSNISQGQKQLICIARMLIKNPEIILLDEATNCLDIETEKKFQSAISKITEDKTCIIIAHRLSTIINSDIILVIDNGEIKEQGSHTELLEKQGLYHEMYQYLK